MTVLASEPMECCRWCGNTDPSGLLYAGRDYAECADLVACGIRRARIVTAAARSALMAASHPMPDPTTEETR